MKFIDTGFFISAFISDEENHKKAANALRMLMHNKEELVYSDYVLDELLTWIRSHKGSKTSITVLDMLLDSEIKIVRIQDQHLLAATEIFRKYGNLSFTDCTTVALMLDRGIKYICSFDSDFDSIKGVFRLEG